jgi:type IV pilus assembly protein PilE
MNTDCLGDSQPGRAYTRGFTLIELMIAVAIVAILMSIAVPAYREYVRRGAAAETVAAIGQGRVVAEQFFLDNRTYVGAPCPAATSRFAIACVFAATTYTITATGSQNMAAFVYTINQANARTSAGPWVSGTVNCWITRKGDTC